MQRQTDFYEIPSIYDILHTPGTAREVDGLETTALRFCTTKAHKRPVWLEPACGTGRYLRVALNRGISVVGFDLSKPMTSYAQKSIAPIRNRTGTGSARIFCADMTSFASKMSHNSVDFAFNTINSIRHLESDKAMLNHFEQITRVLTTGGVYAVGVSFSQYDWHWPVEDTWHAQRGRVHVHQIVQFVPPETPAEKRARQEHAFSHLTITRPTSTQHIDSTYPLRCYNTRQFKALLTRSPLRILGVVDELGRDCDMVDGIYSVCVLGVKK